MNVRKELFESILLLILLINFFRLNPSPSQNLIILTAVFFGSFFLFSILDFLKISKLPQIRFILFLVLVIVLFSFSLKDKVVLRLNSENPIIHDGTVQIEVATKKLLKGENPYSINYQDVFWQGKYYQNGKPHPVVTHFAYSPLMFLFNIPFFTLTNYFFNFVDFRITLFFCFLIAALVGLAVVHEKLLFLIFFLLNPIFLQDVFFGANDVILLMFFFLCLAFLYGGKILASTAMLSLATSTKITILPFVPLYFLYLFLKSPNHKFRILFLNVSIFIIINLIIYLPFIFLDSKSLFDDLFSYVLLGGNQAHPIAGWVGVGQWLVLNNIISENSRFPFYLFQIALTLIFLVFSYKFLLKNTKIFLVCILFVFLSFINLMFSRVVQTNYLAFLSEVLLLAGFIKNNR